MQTEFSQIELLTGLIGGLALFLFGMDIMARALKQVAGNSLKSMLERVTGNRLTGLLAGAGITAIIQSSSITTVLLVGFISAGLMSTLQAVPVIMGANIGSTVTAQILAFNVSALALPILSFGFFTTLLARKKATREYGRILLGLGFVFFGMAIMSDAMRPLRSFQPFVEFMASMDNVMLAALIGAGFTALVQSSAATTGILIVMAGQGLITLEPAIALALGANIGTCITALLAAIGHPREALRAALVHTLFNVAGVMIWLGLVDELAMLARAFTQNAEAGAAAVPRQLANVHTFFNVINAAVFLPFTQQFAQIVRWLVPDRAEVVDQASAPKHLNPDFLDVPALAIDALRLETLRLGGLLREMLEAAVPALITGSPLDVDEVRVMDRPVDLLHRHIVAYMQQISKRSLLEAQSTQLIGLIKIANDIEHAGDLIATGMVSSARKRMEEGVEISAATAAVMAELHAEILEALNGVLAALEAEDMHAAEGVRAMKDSFRSLVESFASHEAKRLQADEAKRMQTYTREVDLIETFDDVFKILRRIARTEIALFRDTKNQPD